MHPINHLMMFMIRLLPEGLVKPVAMRYIAGERLEDAIRVLRDLHSKKMMATVDVLGENVSTKEESLQAAKAGETFWKRSKKITYTRAFWGAVVFLFDATVSGKSSDRPLCPPGDLIPKFLISNNSVISFLLGQATMIISGRSTHLFIQSGGEKDGTLWGTKKSLCRN